MNIIEYVIFGIIQGLTEPLPISSSGHLVLLKNLFNTNLMSDLNFEIIANFGSFLAILIIFWKDIIRLIQNFFLFIFKKEKRKNTKNDYKYCWLIVIGSILITAIALFLVRKANGTKEDKDITYKDAIIIGLLQMVALFPGISRSGTALVGCLLCGLSRTASLKYTFMLYFPVSMASMALGVLDIIEAGNISNLLMPYSFGLLASAIVTYFSYQWLSNWVKKGKLWKFSIYCFILAIFVLIYFR